MDANIITLMKRLWAGRKVVVIMSGAGFLLGIAFALMCTKKYDVVAKVMPEYVNQKTPLGALASLSGMGGVPSERHGCHISGNLSGPDPLLSVPCGADGYARIFL